MSAKPRVFESVRDWSGFRDGLAGTLGFVPTMGALHPGHASLIERSARENDRTVLSIFVNPTQFDDPNDLRKYPRTLEADLELAARAGADFVVLPDAGQLYPEGYRYRVIENELSRVLCGASRPGHFDGVLTVVMKLLSLARADRAYFGEKDHQQLRLIEGMVDAFFLRTRIVPCPIVREADGLAMSSRNVRLLPAHRERAAAFPRVLRESATPKEARARLAELGFGVDYVEDREGRRYGAIRVGEVRLIDNVEVPGHGG